MIGNFINIILKKIGDKRSTLEGELSLNGYLIISNYFKENDLSKFSSISTHFEDKSGDHDILFKFPFLTKPLFDQRIINIIRNYLGKDTYLDFASGRGFTNKGNKSDYWHHDSVGHRIKIFICLNDQDESTHTQVIPCSHKINYFNPRKSKFTDSQVKHLEKPKKIIARKNDLFIFDTNILHKGIYSSTPRNIVQMEFSDRIKSYMRGHIGPRKSKFDKSILESPLIARSKLKYTDKYVHY